MNILFFITPKTEVVSILDTDSIKFALDTLRKYKFTSVPILNKEGNYVGTIKEGDLLWYLRDMSFESRKNLSDEYLENTSIMEVPRRSLNTTAKIDSDIEDLFEILISQNFVPIIDDLNIFIGFVKRRDVISYAYDMIKKDEYSLNKIFRSK